MKTRTMRKIYHQEIPHGVVIEAEGEPPVGPGGGPAPAEFGNDPIGQTVLNIEKGIQNKVQAASQGSGPSVATDPDAISTEEAPVDPAATSITDPSVADPNADPSSQIIPAEPDEFILEQIAYMALLAKGKQDQYAAQLAKLREMPDELITATRARFVDDNLSIVSMLSETAVADYAKKFRTKLKATGTFGGAWAEMSAVLGSSKELGEAFFKLGRLGSAKPDWARKLIAALASGAQIGSGGAGPDVIIPTQKDGAGVWLSIKAASSWSGIEIARWQLRGQDVHDHLSESDAQRLSSGSPEERAVLRKRLVIESAAAALAEHEVFLVVVNNDGSWEEICFQPGPFLRDAFNQGTITVVELADNQANASVGIDGTVTEMIRFGFAWVEQQPGALNSVDSFVQREADESGVPVAPEDLMADPNLGAPPVDAIVDTPDSIGVFLEQRGDRLILNIPASQVSTLASATGIFYAKRQWPADQLSMQRAFFCVPDARDTLFKRC